MLQDMNLDTERFEDIVEEARKKISILYPEWTDYNYHDPGITVIELFAWLKEIQQYYLNQIGIQNKDIFFGLLGIARKHNEGAAARIDIACDTVCRLREKSRFYAGDMVFEAGAGKTVIPGNIGAVMMHSQDEWKIVRRENFGFGGKMREYPFGKRVRKGNAFYILFERPLPCNQELDIFFNLLEGSPVDRNPIDSFPFYPLAELSYEYYTKAGFRPVTLKRDETFGLIQDGSIFFELGEEMAETQIGGETGYFIRLRILEQEYDIPPLLSGISANTLLVRQKETIIDYDEEECPEEGNTAINFQNMDKRGMKHRDVNCQEMNYREITLSDSRYPGNIRKLYMNRRDWDKSLLGRGNCFSDQKFILEIPDISYEDFELMTGDGGNFILWQKRDNFYHSGPDDCHYRLLMEESHSMEEGHSTKSAIILFGDGIFGKCPEGEIRILRLKRTKGSRGNVKSDTITKAAPELGNVRVRNEEPACGGRDNETPEESMRRFRRELKRSPRLVTAEDFERAVKETPGLIIHNCKVLRQGREPNLVEIVVKPYKEEGHSMEEGKSVLGAAYRKNIYRYLEDKRMIGTAIRLLSPEYVEVELFGDICLKPQYVNAKKEVEQILESYFQERQSVFGLPVVHSRMVTLLERTQAVYNVKSLTIVTRNEKVIKNYQGDLLLPPNAIALLKSIQFIYRI